MARDWDRLRYRGDGADVETLLETYRVGDYLEAFEENRRRHDLGKYLRSVKQPDRAIEVYDDLIKQAEGKTKDSIVPTALYWKALILNDLGRHKEAIACLEKAIEIYPNCKDLKGDEIPRAKKLLNQARFSLRKQK